MLRRFEMYRFRPEPEQKNAAELERALLDCSRFIPEVLDSIVGWNLSTAPVHLIWEHAYADREAYARYMRHPYHICILDRYLLPDSPERVIANDETGLGLLGYETKRPTYRHSGGLRRIVAFRLATDAADDDARQLFQAMRDTPGLAYSIVAENTLGQVWFPGCWSHIWEQTFENEAALRNYLHGTSPVARAERTGWLGEPVQRALSVEYRLPGATSDTGDGRS